MRANVLLVPPGVEPVSVDEVKTLARVTQAADDDLIAVLTKSARQWVEAYTRRALIAQTWALYVSGRPLRAQIVLPKAPLLSVAKVEVFDEEDNPTVWDDSNYYVDDKRVPGAVVLREGASWPLSSRCANGLVVTYVAGYGAAAADVPEDVRLAIRQLALHWYENRGEAVQSASFVKPPLTIEAILSPYRLMSAGGSCA